MAVSRSAIEFLRRQGIEPTRVTVRPRLAIDDLLVHTIPVEKPLADVRMHATGCPPPDRGRTGPWPPS